jgi:predicted restriction endonuclease
MSELISGSQKIKLYEIIEGNLKELPQSSKAVLNKMGTVEIIRTDLIFEKSVFDESRGDQLRSPKYQYNLLNKLGSKQCALCGCNIPEIIQGAHVWPVSSIKSANHVNYDDKLKYATDGDNGIWLCENHHKLFDRNMILVSEDGTVKYDTNIPVLYMPYLRDFTKNIMLPKIYLNTNFLNYLSIRNGKLDLSQYRTL